jgi:hypothetical protein
MLLFTHWLETHMMPCFYKQVFGMDCPGCGMQRSFIQLLKGEFVASFKMYPALLPVLFTLGLTVVHLSFKLKNGASYILYSYIATTAIIVVSYIIHLLK